MNDFENLKPLGLENIPDKKTDLELKPVPVPPKVEPDLSLSTGFKVDKLKEYYTDMILSGNFPKTATGALIALALGLVMYWLLS
jgi:hypothetical protein